MPTDDERREMAKKLRELAVGDFNDGRFYDCGEVEIALGLVDYGSWYEEADVLRLADLIEPEERTCRMVDNGVELCCSECDCRHSYDDEPQFCMGCGAKVVDVIDGA